MLREISFRTFLQWGAYDEASPVGDKRGDWQAASVCSQLANLHAASHGLPQRFLARDFLLEFGPERPKPEPMAMEVAAPRKSEAEMKMIAMMWAGIPE